MFERISSESPTNKLTIPRVAVATKPFSCFSIRGSDPVKFTGRAAATHNCCSGPLTLCCCCCCSLVTQLPHFDTWRFVVLSKRYAFLLILPVFTRFLITALSSSDQQFLASPASSLTLIPWCQVAVQVCPKSRKQKHCELDQVEEKMQLRYQRSPLFVS